MMASSLLIVTPNILYVSWIGGGGLGAVPLFTASSVYSFTKCMGGMGMELTWVIFSGLAAILVTICLKM